MKPAGTALLTLGRLPKALDLAEALSLAGWRVIVAEPFAWHLARVSRHVSASFQVTSPNENQESYLNDLLSVIGSERVDLLVPVSEEALHAMLVVPRLPDGVRVYSPSQETLQLLHDKWRFVGLAASHGLKVPETALLGGEDAHDLARTADYVLKPVCTCSGQGLQLCNAGSALPNAHSLPPTVVQQQLKGALKSTFTIADRGRVIGTVVYRAAVLSGTVAVAFERLDNETAIEEWSRAFVSKTGYGGFIAFDFMEDEDGTPHAIECNPRVTSGIHFMNRQDLAGALLKPDKQNGIRLRKHRVMQQFWPTLTETQTAMFKRDAFLSKLKVLATAKEVNFSWRDPLPLWLMPFTSYEIMRLAFLKGETFGEAATHDIGWYSSVLQAESV